jgi:CDP-diacylglycerol--inositol 3-phosphatidyltransferase
MQNNVIFYLPNLITYFRLALLIFASFIFENHPVAALNIYLVSGLSDMLDGYVSRKFQQSSQYGAVLDYLVDRVGTIFLIMFLCLLAPHYFKIFLFILMVDISSHLAQLYTTLYSGGTHHKELISPWAFLNLYYSSRLCLAATCFFYDFFLGFLALSFAISIPAEIYYPVVIICFPGFMFKNIVHLLQLFDSFNVLAKLSSNLQKR